MTKYQHPDNHSAGIMSEEVQAVASRIMLDTCRPRNETSGDSPCYPGCFKVTVNVQTALRKAFDGRLLLNDAVYCLNVKHILVPTLHPKTSFGPEANGAERMILSTSWEGASTSCNTSSW
jgi:hypothetical protein